MVACLGEPDHALVSARDSAVVIDVLQPQHGTCVLQPNLDKAEFSMVQGQQHPLATKLRNNVEVVVEVPLARICSVAIQIVKEVEAGDTADGVALFRLIHLVLLIHILCHLIACIIHKIPWKVQGGQERNGSICANINAALRCNCVGNCVGNSPLV